MNCDILSKRYLDTECDCLYLNKIMTGSSLGLNIFNRCKNYQLLETEPKKIILELRFLLNNDDKYPVDYLRF